MLTEKQHKAGERLSIPGFLDAKSQLAASRLLAMSEYAPLSSSPASVTATLMGGADTGAGPGDTYEVKNVIARPRNLLTMLKTT